jgi:hypothetical protein
MTGRAAVSVDAELRPMNGRSRPKTLPGKDVVLDLSPDRVSTLHAS